MDVVGGLLLRDRLGLVKSGDGMLIRGTIVSLKGEGKIELGR